MLPSSVVGDVQVWRAAMQVSPEDRRPTGPVQLQKAARTWQLHLDRQVAGDRSPALQEWGWLLNQLSPNLTQDPFAPVLADRLAAISRAGVDARQLLHSAITTGGPLPDDHAAAAVWWRISRHLTPAVTAQADTDHTFTTAWTSRLVELVGADRADTLQASRVVASARYCGRPRPAARLAARRPPQNPRPRQPGLLMQARRWCGASRCSPTRCPPTSRASRPLAPRQRTPGTTPSRRPWRPSSAPGTTSPPDPPVRPMRCSSGPADQDWVEPDLAVAALVRGVAGPPEQTDADVNRMFTRATPGRNVRSAATG